jgi:hypothetical protein
MKKEGIKAQKTARGKRVANSRDKKKKHKR